MRNLTQSRLVFISIILPLLAVAPPAYAGDSLKARAISAPSFQGTQYTLSVTKAGSGGGQVASSPLGIDCGATCTASFDQETMITLSATPDANSVFTGWEGDCSGTTPCALTMDAAKTVTATFTLRTYQLSVFKGGVGNGTISSSPPGISCGTTCAYTYNSGTQVTLTATPDAQSVFSGWGGACSGSDPTCTLTIDGAKSVTATFSRKTYQLSASRTGDGSGRVTSVPTGIDCGSSCSFDYVSGTLVSLTATPNYYSAFAGWSGACSGSGPCNLTMDAAQSVVATFISTRLTVSKAGNGLGTVTSAPAGISCGSACAYTYANDTTVVLAVTIDPNSVFSGWSGACSGTDLNCSVMMTTARLVTATFTLRYDLVIAKSVTPTSARPGQPITYTLVFGNAGANPAAGVSITDTMPASLTVTSVISSGVAITDTGYSPRYVWQVQNLAPGQAGLITVTGQLSASLPSGIFTNTATIGAAIQDGNPANNTSSAREVVDVTPPDTIITAQPPNPSQSSSASFSFTGSDPGGSGVAYFQCRLDAGDWTMCASPASYTGLSESAHTWEVRAVDHAGNPDASPATYPWTVNLNDPPSDVTLSSQSVDENQPATSLVGTLSTTDPDAGDAHTYSLTDTLLCPGPDHSAFHIDGSQLRTSAVFDYETKASFSLCIRADDGYGGVLDKQFVIAVGNVNEAPVNTLPGVQATNEDTPLVLSTAGGNPLSIADVDAGSHNLLTSLAASHGALTLSNLGGLDFSCGLCTGDGAGDTSMTFQASITDVNAALDGMQFAPTPNFHGAASMAITLDDQGHTGSGGPQSDSDVLTITVRTAADLGISKQAQPASLAPGEAITYTVVVTNAGPSDISGAALTDHLPGALLNPTWTCAAGGGASCPPPGNGSGPISVTLDLPEGGIVTYTVGGVTAAWAASLVNTATITSPQVEIDQSNNSVAVTSSLGFEADLSITKTSQRVGATMHYTLAVGNAGPSNANGARVTDEVPEEINSPVWACAAAGGAACGALSGSGDIDQTVDLPAGGIITYTLNGTPTTPVVVNTARVSPPPGVHDPFDDNNQATERSGARSYLPAVLKRGLARVMR